MATYKEVVSKYISKVMQIYNSNPARGEACDGSNGKCDCIGLPIGSLRRMGLKWTGIHGCNYTARKECTGLTKLTSADQLEVGDIVFKAVPKGHANWRLPSRYWQGHQYYNGDLNDYYHAGVVESVNPLRIRQMSAHMCTDNKINTYYPWNYKAKLNKLLSAASDEPTPQPTPTPGPEPEKGSKAVVVAQSGGTVNLRKKPSTNAKIMVRVPLGKTVEIITPGESWAYIRYGGHVGYMMVDFLDIIGDGKGKY